MGIRTTIAAAAVAATLPAWAADLPMDGGVHSHGSYEERSVVGAAGLPGRWIDPIHVGAILPRAIPLRPMPARYGIVGYGYAFVNGQPLLIDRSSREIVKLLGDQ